MVFSERLVLNLMYREQYTQIIKKLSSEKGFDYCGIAKAEQLDEDARRLESRLHNGYHGSMHYMENYFDLRIDFSRSTALDTPSFLHDLYS